MAQRKLADLPLEILHHIAHLVRDTHRPSFYALCATNKRYRLAFVSLIFRELHVSVSDYRALQDDVNLLLDSISSTVCCGDVAKYVCHLHLKGFLSLTNSDGREDIMVTDYPGATGHTVQRVETRKEQLERLQSEGLDELLDENEPLLCTSVGQGARDHYVKPEQNAAWIPVANLIKSLPNLTEMVYNCTNQFPPILLNVLHSHRPQCRLYHNTFRLRSLRSKFARLDPHELMVATSPCLYSIRLICVPINEDGEPDQNPRAIWELVAGLAPNLKEVSVIYTPVLRQLFEHRTRGQHWKGLPGFSPGQTGSLTLLSVTGRVPPMIWEPESLQTWASHTDFSSLRRLSLGGAYYQGTRESQYGLPTAALEFLARACSFPQLESLHILLMRRHLRIGNVDPDANAKYTNAAIAFFDSLRPLRKLSVAGSILPDILDTILTRHGRTVVDLKLCPFENKWAWETNHIYYIPMSITKAHIQQINNHCPALENLSIYIKRTMSDASEVGLYTSLARIRPLQSLFLTLDCSNWRVGHDPDLEDEVCFDEDDKVEFGGTYGQVKRGHVRQSFINCAVDESLARSIWNAIATRKDGRRLLSIKLHTTGGMNLGMHGGLEDMADIVQHLSRSWLIERGVRDDEHDALHVRELGLEARKSRDKELQDECKVYKVEDEAGDYEIPHPGEQIFRRIWPKKEVGSSWKDDWKSFPLQIS